MARINIEECWWSDPRREKLGVLLGNPLFAEGVAVRAWRLAQEHWEKERLIPGYVFVTLVGAFELLQANLASLHKDQSIESAKLPTPSQHISNTDQHGTSTLRTHTSEIQDAYVYVRGSCEYLSWGREIRQKRVLAGQISAQRPRDSKGRLLSWSTETQHIANTQPTKPNIIQLSGSGSGSSSSSNSGSSFKKSNVGIRIEYPQEFDQIWALYNRPGSDKKASYQEYVKLRLSDTERHDLDKAIRNYVKNTPDAQFRSHFQRFLKSDWRECLKLSDLPVMNGHAKSKAQLRRENNEAVIARALEKMDEEPTGGLEQ